MTNRLPSVSAILPRGSDVTLNLRLARYVLSATVPCPLWPESAGFDHNARPKPVVPAYYHRSWHARCPGFPHRGPYDCATVARMTRPPDDLPCFGLIYRRNA